MEQYNESDIVLQEKPQSTATNTNTYQRPQVDYPYQYQQIPQPDFYNSIINSLSGWMKFLGIFTIVIGAITCIGIISAAIGVPMIFAGISLTNASKSVKEYADFKNPNVLYNLFSYLKKYFKIQGILAIVSIALAFVYIVIVLVILALGAYSYMYNY